MANDRLIIPEWGIDANDNVSKEDILLLLQQRVLAMLSGGDIMAFMQLMYRLDIPENQLEQALDSSDSHILIAQLIWDRQVQKSMLRRTTTPPRKDDDEGLAW